MLLENAYELPERYSIELLQRSERVSVEDVIAFWTEEAALPRPEEAERRVGEVLLIAVDLEVGGVAGVSSAYLQRNDRLRATFWHQRGFVGSRHRETNIGMHFAIDGINHLERQFIAGEDRRAIGVIQELENEGLKAYFNLGSEPPTGMTFIGENASGDHVRVHYFDGAAAPLPV